MFIAYGDMNINSAINIMPPSLKLSAALYAHFIHRIANPRRLWNILNRTSSPSLPSLNSFSSLSQSFAIFFSDNSQTSYHAISSLFIILLFLHITPFISLSSLFISRDLFPFHIILLSFNITLLSLLNIRISPHNTPQFSSLTTVFLYQFYYHPKKLKRITSRQMATLFFCLN